MSKSLTNRIAPLLSAFAVATAVASGSVQHIVAIKGPLPEATTLRVCVAPCASVLSLIKLLAFRANSFSGLFGI